MASWILFRIFVLGAFSSVIVLLLLLDHHVHLRWALSPQGYLTETISPPINTTAELTKCQDCFRPAASKALESLVEVPLTRSKLKDEPVDYFVPQADEVSPLVTDYAATPTVCGRSRPFLLVLQMSILDDSSTRAAVRSTWASVAAGHAWPQRKMNADVKVVFVVGRKAGSVDGVRRWGQGLADESASHGDVLFLNMDDTYRNLTLKVLSSFYWAKVSCPGLKFVTKVDADTFVNLPLLVDTLVLAEARLNFSIVGFVYPRDSSAVMRGGQWGVKESLYPMTLYPEYASGCAYLLSQETVSSVVGAAPYIQTIPVEDAFVTGIMRYVVGCRLFSNSAFFTHHSDMFSDRCVMKHDLKIMATGCNSERLKDFWATYLDSGLCS